jgi:SAM-dependent methyltransferase
MCIDYDHAKNPQTPDGPLAAIPVFFAGAKPQSLLDVGCGHGAWLGAAHRFGVLDVVGVDGLVVPDEQLLISPNLYREIFKQHDLTQPLKLGRRFDAVLCLEVAEHLDEKCAPVLIDSLVAHSDRVVFSAACPGQPGQHHVNCQWPSYWQKLFNERGYVCTDEIRSRIWNDERIGPWYRQNVFAARRDSGHAGREPRISSILHPDVCSGIVEGAVTSEFPKIMNKIEQGRLPFRWYVRCFFKAAWRKFLRRFCK